MAIVRMQKLHLLAARSRKTELMTRLMLLGCAEIREQSALLSDPRLQGLISREKSDLASLRQEKALFGDAVKREEKTIKKQRREFKPLFLFLRRYRRCRSTR